MNEPLVEGVPEKTRLDQSTREMKKRQLSMVYVVLHVLLLVYIHKDVSMNVTNIAHVHTYINR